MKYLSLSVVLLMSCFLCGCSSSLQVIREEGKVVELKATGSISATVEKGDEKISMDTKGVKLINLDFNANKMGGV